MDGLGPIAFFGETDRLAIVQQLRMREMASRNIADYYQAMREVFESQGYNPENQHRIEELDKGIAAQAEAQETAHEYLARVRSAFYPRAVKGINQMRQLPGRR
jgi:hypothetical protein